MLTDFIIKLVQNKNIFFRDYKCVYKLTQIVAL